jgi:hypothetical protein
MNHAGYRKYNDRSLNSSTYHKKDGTCVRAKLKQALNREKQTRVGNLIGKIMDSKPIIPRSLPGRPAKL